MSRQTRTDLQKYFSFLVLSDSYETATGNAYQYAKHEEMRNIHESPIEYIFKTIKNVQLTPQGKQRLNKIKYLPQHDNLVPVCAKGYKKERQGLKPNEVYILSDFLEGAENLGNVISSHREFNKSVLTQIFYQVVKAMVFLQQNQINHLRLNPSAILIKFPSNQKSKEKPVVRVCDIGIGFEPKYVYQYCLHADYFNNINPYTLPYDECVKYDLWALGVLLYMAIKQQKPFYGFVSFFNDEKIFKQKYLTHPEEWLRKRDNNFSRSFLLQRLIVKCWGLNNEPIFNTWAQVLQFYQSTHSVTRIQKMPISNIFTNHIRLMFVFSKIYLQIRQQLKYKTNSIWQNRDQKLNRQRQLTLMKLSQCLCRICDLYHNKQFQIFFKNRCYVLPLHWRNLLKKMREFIENEKLFLMERSPYSQKDYTLDDFIERIEDLIVKFKFLMKEVQSSNKNLKIKLLQKFLDELMICCNTAKKISRDSNKDRCEYLSILYESEVFKAIAISEFGFQMPKYQIVQ